MKVVNENEIIIEFIEDSEVILIRCCKKSKIGDNYEKISKSLL